ncbi:glycosyltransferase family 2 protein [Parasediminibacterium sp. JCM 36343]|uniref:glycosyltransferase family 2 protein n=1 Tax=Parasediminibacterium sp. JCM 36343 TaxID=3374279 RepID=UPI00397CD205
MIKIIIPLAGPSELFSNAGYFYPKPLIEINGKTMIEIVLENPSKLAMPHQFIFIIKEEDAIKFHIDNTLKLLSTGGEIVKLKKPAKGGLCSSLMAIDKIEDNDSILILNGDQVIDIDFNVVNTFWQNEQAEAGLITFNAVHPRWSYARIEENQVVQTAEKNPISNHAIAGYYFFKKAKDFLAAAYESIKNDVQLDGNFFISPVINQYVLQNKKVKSYPIPTDAYHSFYSPQMVTEYERNKKL